MTWKPAATWPLACSGSRVIQSPWRITALRPSLWSGPHFGQVAGIRPAVAGPADAAIDGLQALKAPRETYEAAILPVIVVASNSDSDDVAAAFAPGANDAIYKPSDFEALFARIHAHLVRRAAELEVCRLEQTLES